MPIYEYECPLCGHFEVFQKAGAKALKANPDCQHKNCPRKAKRLISAAAFHLKGSGWYKTDYSGKSTGNSAASAASNSNGAAPKESTAGAAAPETPKKETKKAPADGTAQRSPNETSGSG